MIKIISQTNTPIEIDLTGAEGNAYALIAYVKRISYLIGLSEEEIKAIIKEMRSDNYENLIKLFNDNFGEFIIFYR